MDLELSDEQVWIEESVDTLLDRHWPPAQDAWRAGAAERARLWESLVEFGLLSGAGGDLGAIELCLAARAIGGNRARVMLRHILPNSFTPILVMATMRSGG